MPKLCVHTNFKSPHDPEYSGQQTGKSITQAKKDTAQDTLATQKAIEKLHKDIEQNFDYVGSNFAQEARNIHHGDSEARNIYGETTPGEAKSLVEEGVSVLPLPPKIKPQA